MVVFAKNEQLKKIAGKGSSAEQNSTGRRAGPGGAVAVSSPLNIGE
ncbi:hypothetical protein [Rugamonas rubra]|nr:hypothetical protein [Rugamonas rubra]